MGGFFGGVPYHIHYIQSATACWHVQLKQARGQNTSANAVSVFCSLTGGTFPTPSAGNPARITRKWPGDTNQSTLERQNPPPQHFRTSLSGCVWSGRACSSPPNCTTFYLESMQLVHDTVVYQRHWWTLESGSDLVKPTQSTRRTKARNMHRFWCANQWCSIWLLQILCCCAELLRSSCCMVWWGRSDARCDIKGPVWFGSWSF